MKIFSRQVAWPLRTSRNSANLRYLVPHAYRQVHYILLEDGVIGVIYTSDFLTLQQMFELKRALIGGLFSTVFTDDLVERRQARALVGLDCSDYDWEITRRSLLQPCDPAFLKQACQYDFRIGHMMEVWRCCAILEGANFQL